MKIIVLVFIFSYSNLFADDYLFDLKDNIINIDSLDESICLIFLSMPTCSDCVNKLNKSLKLLDSNNKVAFVIKSTKNFFFRKQTQMYIKDYCKVKTSLFYYDCPMQDSILNKINYTNIFSKYNIKNTPDLLLKKNKTIYYYSYEELFHLYYTEQTIKERLLSKLNK